MGIIKNFNSFINEAIINPIEINYHTLSGLVGTNLTRTELVDAINNILNSQGIYFLNYDSFYANLSESEKRGAPPRMAKAGPGIKFAYFDTANNRMTIVYDDDRFNPIEGAFLNDPRYEAFIHSLSKIIRHENVHMQQHTKHPRTELPNAMNPKAYFGNQDEIMAHARTAADEIKHLPISQIKKILSGDKEPPMTSLGMYRRTFRKDDPEYKKFLKYLYLYLEDDGVIE